MILVISGLGSNLYAQNLQPFFIKDVFQQSYYNPALNTKGNINLATTLGVDISTNGPSLAEITNETNDGKLVISAETALDNMNDYNDIYGYTNIHTLDFSINTPLVRLTVGHALKASGWTQYSKNLAELITYGNAPYVGQTLDIGPKFDFLSYHEFYLGVQKSFGPLSVGANFKYLSGTNAFKTESSKLELTTSDDIYQLHVNTDYRVLSSNSFVFEDITNFDLNVDNYDFNNAFNGNNGFAIDLGAAFEVNDKLQLSASIMDLGSINWNTESYVYSSNISKSYEGVDISDYFNNEEEFAIEDSLKNLLELEEEDVEFSTSLPSHIYIGGTYQLTSSLAVGALIHSRGSGDQRTNSLALNATTTIGGWLSVGGMYVIKENNFSNLGLFASGKIGPVRGFISTDNVVSYLSPENAKSANIIAGLNIQI